MKIFFIQPSFSFENVGTLFRAPAFFSYVIFTPFPRSQSTSRPLWIS